jgi:hypothetical protein
MHGIAEPNPNMSELALARAWADGELPESFLTRDGTAVKIIYRGVWTHGLGPDFADAMISWPNGTIETGSLEIHLRTTGWREHRHHLDPAYDRVILHVVGIDDGAETRRADGKIVPVVTVGLEHAHFDDAGLPWARVGGEVCAADLAATRPGQIVSALRALGDDRLASFTTSFEAELHQAPPHQVMWRALLDALGISENRIPMQKLAALLPIVDLERAIARHPKRFEAAMAHLLGCAGFLPLAPADADRSGLTLSQIAEIEAIWMDVRRPSGERLSPGEWNLNRVRPANHPIVRLKSAAAMVATTQGAFGSYLLEPIRNGTFEPALLQHMSADNGATLGSDRAIVLASRVLIPFALALAELNGDTELTDAAMATWDSLPASAPNQQTRAAQIQITGGPALRSLGERGTQGLIQLHRSRCQPRRCFECPIAALVVADSVTPSTPDGEAAKSTP